MTKKKLKKWFDKIINIIEDIVTILIAMGMLIFGWFIDNDLFTNNILLWSGVISILIIMAIGNIRDRNKLYNDIQETTEKTLAEIINSKIYDVDGADQLFTAKKSKISERIESGTTIDVLGITLSTSVGDLLEKIKERVKVGSEIRIIIIDSDSEEVLSQLVKVSWSKKAKIQKYKSMIDNTIDLIKELGIENKFNGSLKIGLLPFIPNFGLTLIDSNQENAYGIVTLYTQLRNIKRFFTISSKDTPKTFKFYKII